MVDASEVAGVHVRSLVAVGFTNSGWESGQSVNCEQTASAVAFAGVDVHSVAEFGHNVIAVHTRCDVSVGASF